MTPEETRHKKNMDFMQEELYQEGLRLDKEKEKNKNMKIAAGIVGVFGVFPLFAGLVTNNESFMWEGAGAIGLFILYYLYSVVASRSNG